MIAPTLVETTYMKQRIINPFIAYSSIDNERDGVNLMTINAQETLGMRYSFLPGQNEKDSYRIWMTTNLFVFLSGFECV